jgi:hypothetical protein
MRSGGLLLTTVHLVLAMVTLPPLLGIVLMENGAQGLNTADVGHPNGASVAYSIHLLVMLSVYALAWSLLRPAATADLAPGTGGVRHPQQMFQRLAWAGLLVNVGVSLFMVFIVGAADVVRGVIGKGEFRATLGELGVVAFVSRDFICPMVCALVAFLYRDRMPRPRDRALLLANLAATFMATSLWGAKATGILKILPALLLLRPTISLLAALTLGTGGLVTAVCFGMLYEDRAFEDAVSFTLDRATVGAGDSAWKIWDVREIADAYPAYWPTLLSAVGGRLASALGLFVRREGYDEWYGYEFSAVATLVTKEYAAVELFTSNVTATVFGEGVIAFGTPGFLVMSVLAGLVIAANRIALTRAEQRRRPLLAVVAANFFAFSIWSWLDSGGITSLLNVPHVISYVGTSLLVTCLLFVARLAWRRPKTPMMRTSTVSESLR